MFISLRIVHEDLLLVNVYGPNRDSAEFYCKLNDNAIELGLSDIIMGGDWNLIFNTNLDYCNIIDISITLLDEMFVFERRGYDRADPQIMVFAIVLVVSFHYIR